MRIGPITIPRYRRNAAGLEIYPWQALTTDRLTPEVRALVAKMARAECRSFLDEMKEQRDDASCA